jgi:hypothetical protein
MTRFLSLVALLLAFHPLAAQEEKKSILERPRPPFPEPGSKVPSEWRVLNLNGDRRSFFHCLICRFNLKPVVMIVVKDPGKDEIWKTLVPKLEEMIEQEKTESQLRAFAVVLSPDARASATETPLGDKDIDYENVTKFLVEEFNRRSDLLKRLDEQIKDFKHVVIGCYPPETPKDLRIDPKAEATVILYNRYDVVASWKFEEGALTPEAVEMILAKVKSDLIKKAK